MADQTLEPEELTKAMAEMILKWAGLPEEGRGRPLAGREVEKILSAARRKKKKHDKRELLPGGA